MSTDINLLNDMRSTGNQLVRSDSRERAGKLPDNMVRLKLCFAAAELRYDGQSEAKLKP